LHRIRPTRTSKPCSSRLASVSIPRCVGWIQHPEIYGIQPAVRLNRNLQVMRKIGNKSSKNWT